MAYYLQMTLWVSPSLRVSCINVVHAYCRKWRLKVNVSKSAVLVFARDPVMGK